MKHICIEGLGHLPAGGPHASGLMANYGNAANKYCLDGFRQRVWAGGVEFHAGRLMTIPPETVALQLRPDGLRGANEVSLRFHPPERHEKAYGPAPIPIKAGEIIHLPWNPDEWYGNGQVEVYPCFRASNDCPLTTAHYARFAALEKEDVARARSTYAPPTTSLWHQNASLVLVANDRLTNKECPGLEYVPCKGMRSGLLDLPRGTNNTDHVNDTYIASVFGIEPGWVPLLPCAMMSSQPLSDRRSFSFPIPPTVHALCVYVWRNYNAMTIDPEADKGGVSLRLSTDPVRPGHIQRGSGIILNATVADLDVVCTMSQLADDNRASRVHVRVAQEDAAADAWNGSIYSHVNSCNDANRQQQIDTRLHAVVVVCAANSTARLVTDSCSWDAISLVGAAATNTVDEVRGVIYTANL